MMRALFCKVFCFFVYYWYARACWPLIKFYYLVKKWCVLKIGVIRSLVHLSPFDLLLESSEAGTSIHASNNMVLMSTYVDSGGNLPVYFSLIM